MITSEEQALAYRAAMKARATAQERGRDPVLMLCEVLVLMDRETIERWLSGDCPKADDMH